MVRRAGLECAWTIVRPTNAGDHGIPGILTSSGALVRRGRYLHPGRKPVVRSYAYVGNVVYLLRKILDADCKSIDRRVFDLVILQLISISGPARFLGRLQDVSRAWFLGVL